jgi:GMP synthase PP-ATPase subunit
MQQHVDTMDMQQHIKRQLSLHNAVPVMPSALQQNLVSALTYLYKQQINVLVAMKQGFIKRPTGRQRTRC